MGQFTSIVTGASSHGNKMFRLQTFLCCLFFSSLSSLPQRSSYLAPLEDEEVAASQIISSYGSPQANVLAEASEVVSLYSSPQEEVVFSPSEVVIDYSSPEGDIISSSSAVINDYASPRAEVIFSPSKVVNDYASPRAEVISSLIFSPSKAVNDYASPRAEVISSPSEVVNDYASPIAEAISYATVPDNSLTSYDSTDREAAGSSLTTTAVRADPIAIVRSDFTGPNDGNYHYSYEAANGIKQEVTGEMKLVDNSQVYVMRGSYSYPGADGLNYVVDWYADETGYHPSAPHLPKSVEPITDEVREAVRAQLEFAAQEDAAAAASANNVVYAAPENILGDESAYDDVFATSDLAGYGDDVAASDNDLAGYGDAVAASKLLDSYSLPSYN